MMKKSYGRAKKRIEEWRVVGLAGLLSLVIVVGAVLFQGRPSITSAHLSVPDNGTWVTNGGITDAVRMGDTTYISGAFNSIGPYTGHGVPVDGVSAAPVATYPKVNGDVNAAVADGSGGWYIGGQFSKVGTASVSNLAHILSNGSVDSSWLPSADGTVTDMVTGSGGVFFAGTFSTVNGSSRIKLAAVNATTGALLSWDPSPNGAMTGLAIDGSTVYAVGSFTSIGGSVRNRIAALDATTGVATSWDPNANGTVTDVKISGSTVYIGGTFTTIGGIVRNRIAAIDSTTGSATSFNANANSTVQVVLPTTYGLFAGGGFTNIGGASRLRLALLDETTGSAKSWNPGGTNGTVNALAFYQDNVYVGGTFVTVGGQSRLRAASINADTAILNNWNPALGGDVYALSAQGNTVFIGGTMQSVGAVYRWGLAALDKNGQATDWNPNPGPATDTNYPYSIDLSGNTLYVGGSFLSMGGSARNRLAAVDITSGALLPWNPNANSIVYNLIEDNGTVYVSGALTQVGGISRTRLAAVDAATGAVTNWNPSPNAVVSDMQLKGTTLFIGGAFTTVGGIARSRLAAVDTTIDTNNLTAWNPGADNTVAALDLDGDTLYVGGYFNNTGSTSRARLAAFDVSTDSVVVLPWNPGASASVNDLAHTADHVFAGGGFTSIGGGNYSYLAALSKTSNNAYSWKPQPSSGVNYTLAIDDEIWVGGTVSNFGTGADGRGYFAVYDLPTVSLQSSSSQYSEGEGSMTARVALSGATHDAVTVNYQITGGSAVSDEDYVSLSSSVVIPAGATTADITLELVDDEDPEPQETVILTIQSVSGGATLSSSLKHTFTIIDDDVAIVPAVTRFTEEDPVDLSIRISQQNFPETGSAERVIIARNDNVVDSLTVTPFTNLVDGTLLLTSSSELLPDVLSEINRSLGTPIDSKEIYLVGGTDALNESVEGQLREAGYSNILRFDGVNRRETARKIADTITSRNSGPLTRVMLSEDEAFADALGAGGAAGLRINDAVRPILLTQRANEQLGEDASAFITEHADSITRVEIIGGESAIAGGAESDLSTLLPDAEIVRYAGEDRFLTNELMNNDYFESPDAVVVANGEQHGLPGAIAVRSGSSIGFFPALLGGRFAALRGAPLVITRTAELPESIVRYLTDHAGKISTAYVVGSADLISEEVESQVNTIIF